MKKEVLDTLRKEYPNSLYDSTIHPSSSDTAGSCSAETDEQKEATLSKYYMDVFVAMDMADIFKAVKRKEKTNVSVVSLVDGSFTSAASFIIMVHALEATFPDCEVVIGWDGESMDPPSGPTITIVPIHVRNVSYDILNVANELPDPEHDDSEANIITEANVEAFRILCIRLAKGVYEPWITRLTGLVDHPIKPGLVNIETFISDAIIPDRTNIVALCNSVLNYNPDFIITGTTVYSDVDYPSISKLVSAGCGHPVTVGSPLAFLTVSDVLSLLARLTSKKDIKSEFKVSSELYNVPFYKLPEDHLQLVTAFVNCFNTAPTSSMLVTPERVISSDTVSSTIDPEGSQEGDIIPAEYKDASYPIETSASNLSAYSKVTCPSEKEERVTAAFKILKLMGR